MKEISTLPCHITRDKVHRDLERLCDGLQDNAHCEANGQSSYNMRDYFQNTECPQAECLCNIEYALKYSILQTHSVF